MPALQVYALAEPSGYALAGIDLPAAAQIAWCSVTEPTAAGDFTTSSQYEIVLLPQVVPRVG